MEAASLRLATAQAAQRDEAGKGGVSGAQVRRGRHHQQRREGVQIARKRRFFLCVNI